MTDVQTLIGAILHDTVEDTQTSAEELYAVFGPAIGALVMEVTDDRRRPKAERKQAQIEHAPHLSSRARAVKLADKICNLRDVVERAPSGWDLARRQEYFDWARAVVDGLRGRHPDLEAVFDSVYQARPHR